MTAKSMTFSLGGARVQVKHPLAVGSPLQFVYSAAAILSRAEREPPRASCHPPAIWIGAYHSGD